MVNPWIVGGGIAAGLWALMSGKSTPALVQPAPATPAQIAAQAVAIAQQHVANGVPPNQAAALAATAIMAQAGTLPPPPLPVTYSSTPLQTRGATGPILSLNDPRISEALANVNAMFGSPISANGMLSSVKSTLIAQGWTSTGSYFNPGSLYPPGTDKSKILMVA